MLVEVRYIESFSLDKFFGSANRRKTLHAGSLRFPIPVSYLLALLLTRIGSSSFDVTGSQQTPRALILINNTLQVTSVVLRFPIPSQKCQ